MDFIFLTMNELTSLYCPRTFGADLLTLAILSQSFRSVNLIFLEKPQKKLFSSLFFPFFTGRLRRTSVFAVPPVFFRRTNGFRKTFFGKTFHWLFSYDIMICTFTVLRRKEP
jgi:hypothetical protein